ncbi:MAG: hypothetical protein PHY59_03925 [Methanobacterium sp.]|nr:hypothetical protein [Methanobacterium sp.]
MYIHFKPVKLFYPKLVVSHFVNILKNKLGLRYLDPAVVGHFGRVSVSASIHPKNGFVYSSF